MKVPYSVVIIYSPYTFRDFHTFSFCVCLFACVCYYFY